MKLVIFGDGITYPGKEGVSHHLISQSFALSKYPCIIELILILCDRGTTSIKDLESFPWKTILVPHDIYYDYRSIEKILNNIKPDIVQSYSSYHGRLISSRYSLDYKVPFVMEHHDIESELTNNLNIDTNTAKSIHDNQIELCQLASLNRTLSSYDKRRLTKIVPERTNTFFNLPTIIGDLFKDTIHKNRNHTDVLFIGNGAYPPNYEAVDYICNKLAVQLPNIHFHIVGRLSDKINNTSNVTGYGMVDDLKPIISKMSYGIAPLISGSGLKIKVLTYLSAGLPVIGTPLAFHGFNKNQNLISASLKILPSVIQKCTNNYRNTQTIRTYEYFIKEYSEEANINRLINAYKKITYNPHITDTNSIPITRDDTKLLWLKEFREKDYNPTAIPIFINF